jgi:predicted secreted Zn-dependent protease
MLPSTTCRPGQGRLALQYCAVIVGVTLGLLSATIWLSGSPGPASAVMTERGVGSGGPATILVQRDARAAAPPDAPVAPLSIEPADGVQVTYTAQSYAVEGASLGGLLASLRARGPQDGGETWAANTAWIFRWSYRTVADPDCRVAAAHVDLALTSTAPEWQAPPDVAPSLVTAWDGYLANVEIHEHGHQEIAESSAAELVQALQALPAQTRCDDLATAARGAAGTVLARHAEAQAAYDRETAHGAAQGAVLSIAR